jgi:plasmid stabilization system protein ParE
MATLSWSEAADEDLEAIFDYLAEFSPVSARHRVANIRRSVEILKSAPLLGHPITGERRRLVVGKRHSAYIATYRYDPHANTVYILHVWSQRTAPYV